MEWLAEDSCSPERLAEWLLLLYDGIVDRGLDTSLLRVATTDCVYTAKHIFKKKLSYRYKLGGNWYLNCPYFSESLNSQFELYNNSSLIHSKVLSILLSFLILGPWLHV